MAYSDIVMGRMEGDTLKLAPKTDKPQAASVDVLELRPVPLADIEGNTFDGDNTYYAKPDPATAQAWLALQAILSKRKVALVTKGAFRRGMEKLWRVDLFRDYLILREIVFPEAIRETPELPEEKLDKQTLALVSQFLEGLMTTWDSIDTTDRSREQLKAWLDSGEQETRATEKAEGSEAATSLMEQLQQAMNK